MQGFVSQGSRNCYRQLVDNVAAAFDFEGYNRSQLDLIYTVPPP